MTLTIDVQGATVEFLTPLDEEPCVMRGTIPAGMTVPVHSHADFETFVILSGEVEGFRDPDWVRVGAGDVFNVPGDRKHGWRNVGSVPAEMIVVTTAKIARFFREVADATPEEFLAISERYGYWNDREPLSP
jgi:quercetin dioxygenase-like cupin family protein